ncbi:MAG: ROK family glucokinase [Micromonosporaceae bacterium]
MTLTIGVDVGGTKVLAAVVDPNGTVIAETRRDTPAENVAGTLATIVEVIRELAAGRTVEAVGIGAAGWIDEQRATVLFAPNLAWKAEPLRDKVAAEVDLPVVVENDANVAGWAEYRFGAAESVDNMVLLTVGTGIGGAIVLAGNLVRGAHGIAAELGHVLAVPDGYQCGCGRLGCLEQYASGRALVREAKRNAETTPDKAAELLARAGGDPERIDGPAVTDAARAGDPAALAAFADVGYWLGTGMADLVQVLDPEMIVVGGGVIEAGELLLGPAREACAAALPQRSRLPYTQIRAAEMGPHAGVVGASDLARRR